MLKILKLYFIIDNHTSMNIVENDKCCVFFINTLYFFGDGKSLYRIFIITVNNEL